MLLWLLFVHRLLIMEHLIDLTFLHHTVHQYATPLAFVQESLGMYRAQSLIDLTFLHHTVHQYVRPLAGVEGSLDMYRARSLIDLTFLPHTVHRYVRPGIIKHVQRCTGKYMYFLVPYCRLHLCTFYVYI